MSAGTFAAQPVVSPLPPGSTLGLLGGGQLGRMFIASAHQLNYRVVLLDPEPDCPASALADRHLCAEYDDPLALAELAHLAQAVTTEFENVPAASLLFLAQRTRIAPSASCVATAQNRVTEKTFFSAQAAHTGVHPVPWFVVETEADINQMPGPMLRGILKTAQLGYDGKGQARVQNREQLRRAWHAMGQTCCVLEQWLALDYEVSLVLARGADGQTECYPMAQNEHRDGILHTSSVPAPSADPAVLQQAQQAALHWVAALDYVGVICFEFFVLKDGTLLVNEMAPRPHNSGHYSLDACQTSQFEQQVRALAQLPLLAPDCHSPAMMLNLLGELWQAGSPDFATLSALPGTFLHLYGKQQARKGRKMGHVTLLGASLPEAQARLERACAIVGLA
jgi:5-(carboxyamino)imidazole ribonucleotide synthase